MTETTVTPPYVMDERGAANPRRVLTYASATRKFARGMSRNADGVFEIVAGPDEVATVKIDFGPMFERGEVIRHAEVRGATVQNFYHKHVLFTVSKTDSCGRTVSVLVITSTGDRIVTHFIARSDLAHVASAVEPEDVQDVVTGPSPSIWGSVEW